MSKLVLLKNNDFLSPINREYRVLEFRFSDFSETDKEKIIQEAEELAFSAHSNSANSGENRSAIVKQNDAYAGILAEFVTLYFLNSLKNSFAYRPEVHDTKNQIDISWSLNGQNYSVEVRSSFVKNGLNFGLFGYNASAQQPYFDILGPYFQSNYKSEYESVKNVYARVFFERNKFNVKERFIKYDEPFYLIGFMSGDTIVKLDYHKPLTPGSAVTKEGSLTGSYYVAPINMITDVGKMMEYYGRL